MKQLINDSTTRARVFYGNIKKYQPLIAFLAGFTWDSLTLTRIDLLLDNLIMFSYILLTGFLIYVLNLVESKVIVKPYIIKHKDWLENAIQFFFGGLFSAYVVYYFQSASLTKNWLFLLFLIILLVNNELTKNRKSNFHFQIIIYYMATFSFFIFYLPILFKSISALVFVFSGIISSGFVAGLIYFLYKKIGAPADNNLKTTVLMLAGIFIIFNVLYFTNLIPPVPLSLKEAGIFHHIERVDNDYLVRFEKGSWYQPFKKSDDIFHFMDGDVVYCFASVFAPTNLITPIYHHWQFYDAQNDEWISSDRTTYKINGGRDAGYRGFTNKRNVRPGLWRVDVQTGSEQLLGRISFEIAAVKDSVLLEEIIK